jgi:RNA recognition motif-containing protein
MTPHDCRNKEDISNYFNHYGTITDVVTINKNREFSGAALVTFTSLSDADEAIERLRNTTIPGVIRSFHP